MVNNSMANTGRGRKQIKRGAGQRMVDGKTLRLVDEVRYIQRRAADHDGRIVTIGQLVLFSTDTGDAWMANPISLQLASALLALRAAAFRSRRWQQHACSRRW